MNTNIPAVKSVDSLSSKRIKTLSAKNPVFGLLLAISITLIFWLVGTLQGYNLLSLMCLALTSWLAIENGGNDVSKGIAPLVASKSATVKSAILFGTLLTVLGSMASLLLASKVLQLFTSGLIQSKFTLEPGMVLAIAGGTALWVAVATLISMPVSTTHALIGSVVAVGSFAFGIQGVLWGTLFDKVVLPLLVAPFLGLISSWIVLKIISIFPLPQSLFRISTWFTSGGICFVRAVNDTPKIVAIASLSMITTHKISYGHISVTFMLITISMAVGSYFKGMSVTKLLAEKVTSISDAGGLSSSLTSVVLIYNASSWGLPVSTTHVSTGGIIGAGLGSKTKSVNWTVVRDIVLSWVVTLPGAALIGGVLYLIINLFT